MKKDVSIEQLNLESEAMFILIQQSKSTAAFLDENVLLQIYREAITLNDQFDVKIDAQKALSQKIKKIIVNQSNVDLTRE
jgi:hypothetical protein